MTIQVSSLSFGYPGGPSLLSEWHETFHPGELVSLTGSSGRGKSTLLYILGLMVKPLAGRVAVGGIDAYGQSDAERAHLRATRYGFVFQDASLDTTRTVIDNVVESALYRGEDRRTAIELAIRLLRRFDVDVNVHRRPGQVSGGQAQRIALCRALLGNPSYILADEPTGNLDHQSAQLVIRALRERADSGAVVIIATHDNAVVAECNRKIEL